MPVSGSSHLSAPTSYQGISSISLFIEFSLHHISRSFSFDTLLFSIFHSTSRIFVMIIFLILLVLAFPPHLRPVLSPSTMRGSSPSTNPLGLHYALLLSPRCATFISTLMGLASLIFIQSVLGRGDIDMETSQYHHGSVSRSQLPCFVV